MTINKFKVQIIGVYILVSLTYSNKGLCQSYSVIDLDKVDAMKLPEKQKEEPIPDGMLSFNDIIKIEAKRITPYEVDYVPVYQCPIISKGNIIINLDNNKNVYNLETSAEIHNTNKFLQNQYDVFEFEKKKQTQSLFGTSYNVTEYLASVDQTNGDTLWKKEGGYLTICQASTVSFVVNDAKETFIIDNKTGKELFKLNSLKPLSISEIKEDNGYLYLRTNGSTERELIAINIQKGELAWKVKGNFNKFLLDESRIYTSNQCAIDKETGKLIWNNSSDIWIIGIVGNYLIGYLYGEDDPEIFVYNKNTGKLAGYLWSDYDFCASCLGYESCFPEFIFAEQGAGNKTAALVKCSDGVYLYVFELVEQK